MVSGKVVLQAGSMKGSHEKTDRGVGGYCNSDLGLWRRVNRGGRADQRCTNIPL
jgi:hypothetical protein